MHGTRDNLQEKGTTTMGMASSQARLLMLTSRLHDIEYKAQRIQDAKVQLSTQEDEVYEAYQKALDATTLTMRIVNGNVQEDIPATFNSVFGIGAERPASMPRDEAKGTEGYILLDSRGRVVVDDDVYDAYHNFQNSRRYNNLDNAYAFAFYMVEGQRNFEQIYHDPSNPNHNKTGLQLAIGKVYNNHRDDLNDKLQELFDVYHKYHPNSWPDESTVAWVINDNGDEDGTVFSHLLGKAMSEWASTDISEEDKEIYDGIVNYFWSHYGNEVFNIVNDESGTNLDGDDYDSIEFNYYVRLYNAIQQHGGCISISDFSGPNGDAATDSEWLTAMIESGQMSIEKVTVDKNGNATLTGVGVSSDTNFNFTTTSTIDKAALARAEAKYEHDLKIINKKDEKFDKQLDKLETERTAITKEYDSIKKVSDDNIERSFGIFS